jgi:replicative DNA helicase
MSKQKPKHIPKEPKDGFNAPQDSVLEEIILGSVLLDKYALDKIAGDFNTSLFFNEPHVKIADAIITLYRENTSIDLVTVVQQLKKQGDLESVGGYAYVSHLTSKVGTTANLETHLRLLQQFALKRNLIQVSSEITRRCFMEEEDVFDVFAEAQVTLDQSLKSVINYRVERVGNIHQELIKESIRVLDSKENSGVPTGLRRVDNVTNGFQKSDLIILAGRPSMGKTATALSMIIHPCIEKGIPIAVFSLEMSKEQVVGRIQSALSEVNVSKIVKKQLTIEEIDSISKKGKALETAPLFIDDTANISVLDLKGKCRKLAKEHGVQMIVIDYLQLMRSGVKTQSREQEIAEISRGLKIIAKELNVPVIALSQLSRNVEQRGGDKKPNLSDLRESGQIEQDADMVMFCYRPEYYGYTETMIGDREFNAQGLFVLIVAKHRNGELGEIPLQFVGEYAKITNLNEGFTNNSSTFVQHRPESSPIKDFILENSEQNSNNRVPSDKDSDIDFGAQDGGVPF